MSDSLSPRIRVTLPEGGGDTPGRLLRWRQDEAGAWWAEVTVHVPANAVTQVDGEDYSRVPREPAPPRYVLATDTRLTPPAAELHLATCWEISRPATWRRITPMLDGVAGPDMLRFDDTTRCPLCLPPDTGAPR